MLTNKMRDVVSSLSLFPHTPLLPHHPHPPFLHALKLEHATGRPLPQLFPNQVGGEPKNRRSGLT